MKTSTITGALGVLALLGSSVGSAATLTMVASNTAPNIGDIFTVALNATDIVNIAGITLNVNWDVTKVSLTSTFSGANCTDCAPATGPLAAGSGTFFTFSGSPGAQIVDMFGWAGAVNGAFPVAVLTFQAIAEGAMDLVVNDDGGIATGWFDGDTAEHIPTSYVQTNVVVNAVPAPAAVWLLGTGLAGLMVRSARRSRAAA